MDLLNIILLVVVVTLMNIIFSVVAQRIRRVFVFVPAFVTLAIAANFLLSAFRNDALGALASSLFGLMFLISGAVTLIVATHRYKNVV